jgi:hypothetical protein
MVEIWSKEPGEKNKGFWLSGHPNLLELVEAKKRVWVFGKTQKQRNGVKLCSNTVEEVKQLIVLGRSIGAS